MTALREAREAMYAVHKLLIEAARAEYERDHPPIAGPGQFLRLLTGDPFFAWLRPMSSLMADLDEALDDAHDEPGTLDAARIAHFRERIEALIGHERYLAALQESADLILEHAALRRALKSR